MSIPENISDVTAAAPVGGTAQSYTKLDGFTKKTVQNEEIHRGDLILVNYLYPYTFPEDNDITAVYGNKTKSYKVSNTETQMALHVTKEINRVMDDFFSRTSCGDIMVVSGFRSFESQQRIYRDRVETEGAEEAEPLAAGVPQALRVSTASRAARVRRGRIGMTPFRIGRCPEWLYQYDSTPVKGRKNNGETNGNDPETAGIA